MKKTMKSLKCIALAAVIVASGLLMGLDSSAATAIQTKMAAKPTSMSTNLLWSLTGSSNVPGITEGVCSDGTYLYVGYVSTSDTDTTTGLRKYNLTTGAVIKTTTPDLGHVNDITYNSKLEKLVVAHCSPIGNMVSIVDPSSLTIDQTYYISKFIYGIEYLSASDTYVVGAAGTENLIFLDSNFLPVNCDQTAYTQTSTIDGYSKDADGVAPQAIASDGTYIYATWFCNKSKTGADQHSNVVEVYDMSGNHITEIVSTITGAREIEGMVVFDSVVYVVYGNPGDPQTYVHKLTESHFN